jgi:hypothetical protein
MEPGRVVGIQANGDTSVTTKILVIAGENCVCENGKLELATPWVYWKPGQEEISLDGDFSVDDLRAIVQHMESTEGCETEILQAHVDAMEAAFTAGYNACSADYQDAGPLGPLTHWTKYIMNLKS